MTAVGEFGAKGFYAGVEHAQANRGGVLVNPVLQKNNIKIGYN